MGDVQYGGVAVGVASSEIVEAIESSWDGVRVNRLDFRLDQRPLGTPGEDHAGVMWVTFSFSGEEQTLVKRGLLSAELLASLPRCGVGSRFGINLHRSKRRVRVTCCFIDPTPEDFKPMGEAEQIIWNRLASVVASALWQPKKAYG